MHVFAIFLFEFSMIEAEDHASFDPLDWHKAENDLMNLDDLNKLKGQLSCIFLF